MMKESTKFPIAPGLTLTSSPRSRRDGWGERKKASRLYVSVRNETILDNLMNRQSRPYQEWRKVIVERLLPAVPAFADAKVRWSQKAGCSCPCSPGFILSGRHLFVTAKTGEIVEGGEGWADDFWLSIDFAALDVPTVNDDEARAWRAAQLGMAI